MFDLATYTTIHTVISFAALAAGLVVTISLLGNRLSTGWAALFLITAVATSATGFGFPFNGILPSHILGAIALAVLALVIAAGLLFHLAGAWRGVYAAGMVASTYFIVFVAIAQAFQKIPAFNALAPTGTELPFAAAQLVALALFVVLGVLAVRAYRPADRRLRFS